MPMTSAATPPAPHPDPIARFNDALARALRRAPESGNACTLATANRDGIPSARIVLLKECDARGFVFFTNLMSRKAQELRDNPNAALTFFWPEVGEQVRVEGTVEPVSRAESAAYFETRPRLSQLGAWASEQSQPLASRDILSERMAELVRRYDGKDVPCPPHWGGNRVVPRVIEFWHAQAPRWHDREVYVRADGGWACGLLNP